MALPLHAESRRSKHSADINGSISLLMRREEHNNGQISARQKQYNGSEVGGAEEQQEAYFSVPTHSPFVAEVFERVETV